MSLIGAKIYRKTHQNVERKECNHRFRSQCCWRRFQQFSSGCLASGSYMLAASKSTLAWLDHCTANLCLSAFTLACVFWLKVPKVLKTLQQTAGRDMTYTSAAKELLRQDGVRGGAWLHERERGRDFDPRALPKGNDESRELTKLPLPEACLGVAFQQRWRPAVFKALFGAQFARTRRKRRSRRSPGEIEKRM